MNRQRDNVTNKVAVVGGGSFGTAMACAASRAGLEVVIWARESEVVESINAGRGNPFFLKGIPIEPGIAARSDLREAVGPADFVLLAVPAQFLRGVAEQMRPALRPESPWCPAPKGSSAAPAR